MDAIGSTIPLSSLYSAQLSPILALDGNNIALRSNDFPILCKYSWFVSSRGEHFEIQNFLLDKLLMCYQPRYLDHVSISYCIQCFIFLYKNPSRFYGISLPYCCCNRVSKPIHLHFANFKVCILAVTVSSFFPLFFFLNTSSFEIIW